MSDDKDSIIKEKVAIIKQLQKKIDFMEAGRHRIILPHEVALEIHVIFCRNMFSRRPSALIIEHNGHSAISVEKLI